ncbi:TonB-dependent receptor plug [Candidatus Desulfarcum epimagneticum]|uniref:TonB-dependent receptor plug n=1 Tax=uncultured Desulfobacteraceae bacterium TaxID=218296 RepID=A0A484HH56_9BACT|nr:TonB-dependent receptor plug [uncultured Desulfobacteraceae bacterium]
MLKKTMMVFALAFFLAGGEGLADGGSKKDDGDIKTLDAIVVTATKTKEKRKDIPNSVIVKDAFDIEQSPASGLGALLAGEPGVDWRSYGDYGGAAQELHIRGMGGSEVQVLVNGISVNSPSLGTADISGINLDNIERIEVVKGSGSLLYGSGAMGGSVNIITKGPERDHPLLKVTAGFGENGAYRLSADQGMFISKNTGWHLSVGRRETDGHRNNGRLTQNDLSLKLTHEQDDIFNVSLYGNYISRLYGNPGIQPPPEANLVFNEVNGEPFYDDESASLKDEGKSVDKRLSLTVDAKPKKWLGIHVRGHWSDMESDDQKWENASTWGSQAGESKKTRVDNRVFGAEVNFEIEPRLETKILIGADIKDHVWKTRGVDFNASGLATGESLNSASIKTRGFFIEAQLRLNRYVKGLAGIRNERHEFFGRENLPLFGLIVNPMDNLALKINHGKHFKAPSPNDLFWPEDNFVRGNPDLKPQTGWHTNAVLEYEIPEKKLDISLSWFKWNIDDKITWAKNPNFPGPFGEDKWTPSNLNKSRGTGWELGLRYNPLDSLGLSLACTLTDAEDETPDLTRQAQYVPEYSFKTGLAYRNDLGISLAVDIRLVGEREYYKKDTDKEPSHVLEEYATVDMKVDYRFNDHWTFSVSADNLFDKDYGVYMGSFADGSGKLVYGYYPGAGRSVRTSLSYKY